MHLLICPARPCYNCICPAPMSDMPNAHRGHSCQLSLQCSKGTLWRYSQFRTPRPVYLPQGRLCTRATELIAGQLPSRKPQVLLHLEHSQARSFRARWCIHAISTSNQKSQQQELNVQASVLHTVPNDDLHHVAAKVIPLMQCLLLSCPEQMCAPFATLHTFWMISLSNPKTFCLLLDVRELPCPCPDTAQER